MANWLIELNIGAKIVLAYWMVGIIIQMYVRPLPFEKAPQGWIVTVMGYVLANVLMAFAWPIVWAERDNTYRDEARMFSSMDDGQDRIHPSWGE